MALKHSRVQSKSCSYEATRSTDRLFATVVVKLTTHGARDGQARVCVGVEGDWVVLDLLDVKTIASVDSVDLETRLEGALEAANAVLAILARGVGERDAERASLVSGQLLESGRWQWPGLLTAEDRSCPGHPREYAWPWQRATGTFRGNHRE